MKMARKFGQTLFACVLILAGAIATVCGCAEATMWAVQELGIVPVSLCGSFLIGCLLTWAAASAYFTRAP